MAVKIVAAPSDSWRQAYVLCLDEVADLKALQRNAGARPNSYAGEIVGYLHDAVFRRAVDLKHDFQTYFRPEYGDFKTYLSKRFLWPPELIATICESFEGSVVVIYLDASASFVSEEFGQRFLESVFRSHRR